MIQDNDQATSLQSEVFQALADETPIQIVGGASKSFYGRLPEGKELSTKSHQGIVNYHPSELVLTARTGTALSEIEKTLAEHGQMLAFDPPYFSQSATLGGTIACGFSGHRRPFTGSARDFVLGCKIINGKAELLSFGGEVMKNVAGYDVSRLMVGAMGTLGLLLEVSLKVLPKPVFESTRILELDTDEALAYMTKLSKQSLPLSGLSYDGRLLYVRLSGQQTAVIASCKKVGGDELENEYQFWQDSKEHRLSFFNTSEDLWRISVPSATKKLSLSGEWFYEWGGGQRWLKTTESSQTIFALAEQLNGYATLFRSINRTEQMFHPLSSSLKQINQNIKNSFDPKAIFNPYRMYRDW